MAEALRTAGVPGLEENGSGCAAYEEALVAAFPVEGRGDLADPDTLRYDYGRSDGDGLVEWWEDEHSLLLSTLPNA